MTDKLRKQDAFPPIYIALLNARDAYLASASKFPKASDRTTLRRQCNLITHHMRQILAPRIGIDEAVVGVIGYVTESDLRFLRAEGHPAGPRECRLASVPFGNMRVPLYTHPKPVRSGVVSDEDVEDACKAYSDASHAAGFSRPSGDGMDWHIRNIRAVLENFAKSQESVGDAARDAARYRWLKRQKTPQEILAYIVFTKDVDQAIDAAMQGAAHD